MSIIITIFSNITVLLSHNVICFGYFMPRGHGVIKNAPTIVSLPPFSVTGFSPGLLVVLQEILYQPFFCSDLPDYCKKQCLFKVKHIFSFNLLLVGFDFVVLCLCVSQGAFSQFLFAYICIASYSASHQMLWHNKRIHDRSSHQRCSWPWLENYKLLSFFVFLGN